MRGCASQALLGTRIEKDLKRGMFKAGEAYSIYSHPPLSQQRWLIPQIFPATPKNRVRGGHRG
ncbi:hypothetical protein ACFLUB_02770 [Chloroflexota bacterium]